MSEKKTDTKKKKNTVNDENDGADINEAAQNSDTKPENTHYQQLLEEKAKELSDMTERYKRLMAEYDNFKKRTVKEKEGIYTDSVKDTVAELLPVIDNLNRALDSFDDKTGEHYKGVEMILRQTEEIFAKLGVNEIKAVGEQFDPLFHNAVMHIEDEAVTENTVVEEFMKGYTYKDKVIRHSMVKVAN